MTVPPTTSNISRAVRCGEESTASMWLRGGAQGIAESERTNLQDVVVPAAGDEIVGYTFDVWLGSSPIAGHLRRILVRVGTQVGDVMICDVRAIPAAPVEDLASALATCFTGGSCGDPVPVPAVLLGERLPADEAGTSPHPTPLPFVA